jgi:hypothetical protein
MDNNENNDLLKDIKEDIEDLKKCIKRVLAIMLQNCKKEESAVKKELKRHKDSTLMLLLGFSLTISDIFASILSSERISSKLKNKFFDFSDKDLIKWVIIGTIFLYFLSVWGYDKYKQSKIVGTNLQDTHQPEEYPTCRRSFNLA